MNKYKYQKYIYETEPSYISFNKGRQRAKFFSHDSTTTYFNVIPPEMRKEIQKLETQIGIKHQSHSDLELMEDISNWVPSPDHTRGRKKQYLISIALH